MQALNKYVEEKNRWNAFFGQTNLLTLDTASGRKAIAEQLDCDLSPENLHCDGEISQAQAMKKYRALSKAAEQLLKLDPTQTVEELY